MLTQPSARPLGKDDVFVTGTLDGSDTIYSKSLQTTYHSTNGAVSESRHVFIRNGLLTQFHLPSISILEIGFGSGLNAFLSLLIAKQHNKHVKYTGIESFPIEESIALQLNYPEYLVAEHSKEFFIQMHNQSAFSTTFFDFKKYEQVDRLDLSQSFDCIYFDAFAPKVQPPLWEQNVFDVMFHITSLGGCLVTYCAQGEVRRRLMNAGYKVNRLNGAPGKREMIQACKSG